MVSAASDDPDGRLGPPRLGQPGLACVVLAHADPVHVQRLVRALDPFPVFLHCDSRSSPAVFAAMTDGLPARCTVLPRLATGWATWGNVAAEVQGYRTALAASPASHVALLTGSDYPLASTARITGFLAGHLGRSVASYSRLPRPEWGPGGGVARLRYRHAVYRKRMLRLPLPRRLPAGVVAAGGSQVKVLSREHARMVVEVADTRRDLVSFWRTSWIPDETFVATVLSSPAFVPYWTRDSVDADLWWIGWDGTRQKSPPWLRMEHLPVLAAAADPPPGKVPRLFARKFSTDTDTDVLNAIDSGLRGRSRGAPAGGC